jgi:hypothetical protein
MLAEQIDEITRRITALAEAAEALAVAIPDDAHPYEDEMVRDLGLTLRGWEDRFILRLDQLRPRKAPPEIIALLLQGETLAEARKRLSICVSRANNARMLKVPIAPEDAAGEAQYNALMAWLRS